jgi:hypothetical protein
LFQKGDLYLDSIGFVKQGALYALAALIPPVIAFLQFGEVIGFKRYWHSLFGMGFEHIGFWDKGILGIARAYANFGGFWAGYNSLILLTALIGPFLLNLAGVGMLYKSDAEDNQKKLERIVTVSVGIMAVFMLFPLEDHKIAVSKFFVFVYVFVALLRNASARTWRNLGFVALVMLFPVSVATWRSLQSMTGVPAVTGTTVMQKVIGLPLHKDIAQELDTQMRVLQRVTRGAAYFVLTSPTYNLLTLPILVDNGRPQYYVRFDAAAVSSDVVKKTIMALEKVPYVIVASGDYQDYLAGKTEDTAFRELMTYVNREFAVVDEFAGPGTDSLATRHMDGFMVLKKRAG